MYPRNLAIHLCKVCIGDIGGTLRQGEKEGIGRMDNKERGRDFRVKLIFAILTASPMQAPKCHLKV
jgi:hypothetical protein